MEMGNTTKQIFTLLYYITTEWNDNKHIITTNPKPCKSDIKERRGLPLRTNRHHQHHTNNKGGDTFVMSPPRRGCLRCGARHEIMNYG